MFTIRADYEHFLYRVSTWCQLRDSLTPALRVWNMLFTPNAMATEIRKSDFVAADDIKNASHAGEAKRLSHDIAPDNEHWEWS